MGGKRGGRGSQAVGVVWISCPQDASSKNYYSIETHLHTCSVNNPAFLSELLHLFGPACGANGRVVELPPGGPQGCGRGRRGRGVKLQAQRNEYHLSFVIIVMLHYARIITGAARMQERPSGTGDAR